MTKLKRIFLTIIFATVFSTLFSSLSFSATIRIKPLASNYKIKSIPVLGQAGQIEDVKKYIGSIPVTPDYEVLGRINAKSAIIIDAKTGIPLYEKAPDQPRQPASTIKVLTAIIALNATQDKEYVPVSRKAARQPRSKVWLDRRKKYRADDLINAVLLASANDASVALAEHIAGSEKDFAIQMTDQARQFGASNTICKTASGLTAKGQQSTVRDLALIFNQAMENKDFAHKMSINKIKTSYGPTIHSHNKALWQVKGALGGKTGFTNVARQTYVGKFKQGDAEIVVAIMGSEFMWKDVKRLVKHGLSKKLALADPENELSIPVAVLSEQAGETNENS